MKNLLALTTLILALAPSLASASQLECRVRENTSGPHQYNPEFRMVATVGDVVQQGGELSALSAFRAATTGDTIFEPVLLKDGKYRPRTDKNRNRFVFVLSPRSDRFDGIIHGVILPKRLAPGTSRFQGLLAYSTDSYHDGIITYAWMSCVLK